MAGIFDDFFSAVTRFQEEWSESSKQSGSNGKKKLPFSGPLNSFHSGDQGTIEDVNEDTHTYVIGLDKGGFAPSATRIVQDPGDKRVLKRGTRVAVTYEFGTPMILGVLPFTGDVTDNENRLSLTGDASAGGNNPLVAGKGGGNFRTKNTPRDLLPGDWAQVSNNGRNAIAVLEDANIMKAGMAAIRMFAEGDVLELICRNQRTITDMGITEIKNDAGTVSLSFRGGSDQLTESGSDQENWAIRFDLGAKGDMLNFELTQPDGTNTFQMHVSNDGLVTLYNAEGAAIFNGGDVSEHTLGSREITMRDDDVREVGGNVTQAIQGNRDATVSMSDNETVGNDKSVSVLRNLTEAVSGKHEETVVGGNVATMTPGQIARETTINGTWKISMGNPAAGANITATPSYDLETWFGDIKNTVRVKGDLSYTTKLGDATLRTFVGITNVDGLTVHLGNKTLAPKESVLRGTSHVRDTAAWIAADSAPIPPYIGLTQALAALITPPLNIVYAVPVVGPIVFFLIVAPIWLAKLQAESASASASLAANTALAALMPLHLSTKVFTE